MLDRRLDGLSVGRRLITSLGFDPRALEFAVYRPGVGFAPDRPALPFQFAVAPWSPEDGANGASPSQLLRGQAAVSNVLKPSLPMPSTSFAFTLALPPDEAEAIYYQDPVADAQQAAADAPPAWLALAPNSGPVRSRPAANSVVESSRETAGPLQQGPEATVRAEVARIFLLPGAAPAPGPGNVTYTARVIGHRLTRRNDRYAEPGSGPWTLLRVVEPGDGWVALNLWEGWGEFFSAGQDEATTTFGEHLARAIA